MNLRHNKLKFLNDFQNVLQSCDIPYILFIKRSVVFQYLCILEIQSNITYSTLVLMNLFLWFSLITHIYVLYIYRPQYYDVVNFSWKHFRVHGFWKHKRRSYAWFFFHPLFTLRLPLWCNFRKLSWIWYGHFVWALLW